MVRDTELEDLPRPCGPAPQLWILVVLHVSVIDTAASHALLAQLWCGLLPSTHKGEQKSTWLFCGLIRLPRADRLRGALTSSVLLFMENTCVV